MINKVKCPIWGKWLFDLGEGAAGDFYIWCKQCRKEVHINIKSEPFTDIGKWLIFLRKKKES